MKRAFLVIIILFGIFSFREVFAQEKIDDFSVIIRINEDSSINVSERIDYDFGTAQKHGIYRDIPVKYKARGGNYNFRISNISVTDENGRFYNFETSSEGRGIRIKIGDASQYVTGKKIYVINYRVRRAINYFNTWDELYWNVTGDKWQVEIGGASAKVVLPQKISPVDLQIKCYFGSYGSNVPCESKIKNAESEELISEVSFGQSQMSPGEDLTIVVGVPKGIIYEPSVAQKFWEILKDNRILFLPVIVFLAVLAAWWKFGRDPKGRGTIIAEYSAPDNLTPTEIGTVMDGSVDKVDISAEIVDLAIKGYLKITKIEKEGIIFKSDDYLLEKLKSEDTLPNEFQKKLVKSLFSGNLTELSKINVSNEAGKEIVRKLIDGQTVQLSDLKNKFHIALKEIKSDIYDTVTDKEYFARSPKGIKKIFSGVATAAVVAAFIFGEMLGGLAVFSLIASGAIIFIFGAIMPARTEKGVETKEYILGLKKYLSVAEKDRIKFHNAPTKNPQHFEKLLPYAMVLGVEKEWAGQFERIYENQNPGWYSDSSGAHFNSLALSDSLSGFSASAGTSLASLPSSASGGGSGFSGGGAGGGGGGGSW